MYRTGANVCNILDPSSRADIVKKVLDRLKPHEQDFDAIAFRGLSGSTVASILADRLGKNLIAVRKDGEPSYSASRQIEHNFPSKTTPSEVRWIICDDAPSTGKTVLDIYNKVKAHNFGEPAAVLFYGTGYSNFPNGPTYTVYEYPIVDTPKPIVTFGQW